MNTDFPNATVSFRVIRGRFATTQPVIGRLGELLLHNAMSVNNNLSYGDERPAVFPIVFLKAFRHGI